MLDRSASGVRTGISLGLLGGRFAVGSISEWLRAWVAVIVLLGMGRLVLFAATKLIDIKFMDGRAVCRWVECSWARLAALLLGLRINVEGIEHIDPRERYVVVSLHEGFADALALYHLPLKLTAVARDELAEFPILGEHLMRAGHIFIEPERPMEAERTLFRSARAAMAAGDSVLIFPQGSILGIELAFLPGAFHLAKRLGRRVLPVVVTGGHRVWEHPFSPTLRFNQAMSIKALPPVPPKDAIREAGEIERRMKQVAMTSDVPPRQFDPGRDGYWDGYRYEIDAAFPRLARQIARHRALRSSGNRPG